MTVLHESADLLRRIEADVARQFAAIPPPDGPEPDLYAADDTRPSELVENLALLVGVAAIALAFLGA